VPSRCKVCKRPDLARLVALAFADGESDVAIADSLLRMRLTRKGDITPGVIAWHRQGGAWCEQAKKENKGAEGGSVGAARAPSDLATLVRDKTVTMMQRGKLTPTLQHGLMAQALIDKRAERMADRQLALTVAGILGGLPAPPGVVVAGFARDVTPELLLEAGDDPDVDDLGPGI
jgi:hypothetical protein